MRVLQKALLFPLLLLCSVIGLVACKEESPVIVSIEPQIGLVGKLLTIYGNNFGNDRDGSYITIGGTPPTAASYLAWSNDQIRIRIPEFGGTGLIYVHRDGKKSNPLLFSNQAAIPEPLSTDQSLGPVISTVKPGAGPIGSLITIEGSGFGASREKSGVFFSWHSETAPSVPAAELHPKAVEVFEADFGYELWNDREIRVRVPDGAVSGGIEVRTSQKKSSPVSFTVTGKPGTKTFKEKRSYTISYTVDIQVQEAEAPNTLYLWVPQPVTSASQWIAEPPERSRDPFVENYQGTTLFQLTDLLPSADTSISMSYIIDVYTVETDLVNQPLKPNAGSPIQSVNTLPSALIPSDNSAVITQAQSIVGKEQNPYEKARKLYEWLLKEGGIQKGPLYNGVLEALEQKRSDPYSASLLFCALARSVGIPAIPVAGVLINRSRLAERHYWAEFWIDGFGWIPLDPGLAGGGGAADFNLHPDPAAYYFGNLDNQRIAFSRGQKSLSQMDPRGRIAVRHRDYALQNLWEEAVGGLGSYSSLWSGITITGMYTQ
ncbi:MAG: IPT/TIG domain-containing protein [Treponema sp.]|jgi:transglutaminase-like putative cysteine protease|nr:IPT/TIG domain-containing protein [Treponema sp.]